MDLTGEFNYYKILGVEPKATLDDIRQAFAELRSGFPEEARDPAASAAYKRLINAYEVLSNPERRATYDSLLLETMEPALSVDVLSSRAQVKLSKSVQRVYLLVDVRAPEQEVRTGLPLNLCLVVDRSTSMRGTRLSCVKSAVELIADKLAADDILSVVTFSDRAEVVLPAATVESKAHRARQIRSIEASGGTEIYQGLSAGVKEMRKLQLRDYANHLILLTDGHTYGDTDECLQLAQQIAKQGIGLSAFGIGSEWNDEFLDRLVASSGGQSGYIESPTQIIDFLQKRIRGLGTIYAKNLRLLQDFPNSVQLQYGFKVVPFAQPLALNSSAVQLGDVEGRSPLSFLLEVDIEPQPVETRINIPLLFVADIPSQAMQERTFKHHYQLYALVNADQEEPPPRLIKAVRMLNMYRMNEKVWEEVEAGRLDVATTRMQRLTTRLLEAGETQLAQQAQREVARLAQAGTMSLEGRKRLKYGTRALINETITLSDDDQM